MSFSLDLSRACEKAKGKTELAVRKVMLELFTAVIYKSPVRSGRFRANWMVGYAAPNNTTTSDVDVSGGSTVGRIVGDVAKVQLGEGAIYLTNSLPYGIRLENGWSDQAPQGMVKLSLVEITNQYGA